MSVSCYPVCHTPLSCKQYINKHIKAYIARKLSISEVYLGALLSHKCCLAIMERFAQTLADFKIKLELQIKNYTFQKDMYVQLMARQ